MNLVPDSAGETPSYWCTWGVQNFTLTDVADAASWNPPARNLDETRLFEHPGWATKFYATVRGDLYVLFDAGWDLPSEADADEERWRLGSLRVDVAKFPSCTGTPVAGLRKLDDMCRAAGWRGAGIWVSPQVVGEGRDGWHPTGGEAETYWRERARWSHEAGIAYWKVDCGVHDRSADYRRMLTRVVREEAPGLVIEHAPMAGPLNDVAVPWDDRACDEEGRFRSPDGVFERAVAFLPFSDVLRTYDVTGHLSVATTLDRVAQILAHGQVAPGSMGLVNCEDEVYIGAALGCAIGVMRHPSWRERPGSDYDPARSRKRIDEVTRAVRWHRLAPAFGVGEGDVTLSDEILFDRWLFREGDSWASWVVGREIAQGAPAVVARGMGLPEVRAGGDAPFVVASRHPNGAVAVATLPRTSTAQGIVTPLADVSIAVGDGSSPIGVFGAYRTLALELAAELGPRRVWAQDLAGEEAVDVTDRVSCEGRRLVLDDTLVREAGLSAATPGDLSEPGLVLKLI